MHGAECHPSPCGTPHVPTVHPELKPGVSRRHKTAGMECNQLHFQTGEPSPWWAPSLTGRHPQNSSLPHLEMVLGWGLQLLPTAPHGAQSLARPPSPSLSPQQGDWDSILLRSANAENAVPARRPPALHLPPPPCLSGCHQCGHVCTRAGGTLGARAAAGIRMWACLFFCSG